VNTVARNVTLLLGACATFRIGHKYLKLSIRKMPREWVTETREPWCLKIAQLLKTIDLHTEFFIKTGDVFHQEQAEYLRAYVYNLKDWIKKGESKDSP
jgi:hypothetical protein